MTTRKELQAEADALRELIEKTAIAEKARGSVAALLRSIHKRRLAQLEKQLAKRS